MTVTAEDAASTTHVTVIKARAFNAKLFDARMAALGYRTEAAKARALNEHKMWLRRLRQGGARLTPTRLCEIATFINVAVDDLFPPVPAQRVP